MNRETNNHNNESNADDDKYKEKNNKCEKSEHTLTYANAFAKWRSFIKRVRHEAPTISLNSPKYSTNNCWYLAVQSHPTHIHIALETNEQIENNKKRKKQKKKYLYCNKIVIALNLIQWIGHHPKNHQPPVTSNLISIFYCLSKIHSMRNELLQEKMGRER